MINATTLLRREALCALYLPDSKSTDQFGYDFAPTLFIDWSDKEAVQKRTRFALIASRNTGKTSFVEGLKSRLYSDILNFEAREDQARISFDESKTIRQSWFHSVLMGHVCHVDLGFRSESYKIIKAYRDGILEDQNMGGVDIVEHPEYDSRSHEFDLVIWLQKSFDEEDRRVREAYIYASNEFAQRPAFQKFMQQYQDRFHVPCADIASELSSLNFD